MDLPAPLGPTTRTCSPGSTCKAEITPEFLSEQWWYTLGDSDLA